MKLILTNVRNEASVRIPRNLLRAAQLQTGQTVEVRAENGRIIIEPLNKPHCDLNELVKGITPKNKHKVIDFGAPVGNEIW